MAAIIKASCPGCGEVRLSKGDIALHVCYERASLSRYTFTCPGCGLDVSKPADDVIVSLLMSGGVLAQVWSVPPEALESHTGPPICYDDLLDLHLALNAL